MKIYQLAALLIMAVVIGPIAMADEAGDLSAIQTKVSNPESAIMLAHKYTGFDELEGYSKSKVTAQKVIPDTKKSPYAASLAGKNEVWEIIYRNVKTGRGGYFANREFSVLIDKDGRLLSIYSVSDDAGSSDTLPQIDPERFNHITGYSQTELTSAIPAADFVSAMNSSPGNPAKSKIIRAFHFCYTANSSLCQNAWVILLHGTSSLMPVSHGGGTVPARLRNSQIVVVNAKNGKWLNWGNIPAKRENLDYIHSDNDTGNNLSIDLSVSSGQGYFGRDINEYIKKSVTTWDIGIGGIYKKLRFSANGVIGWADVRHGNELKLDYSDWPEHPMISLRYHHIKFGWIILEDKKSYVTTYIGWGWPQIVNKADSAEFIPEQKSSILYAIRYSRGARFRNDNAKGEYFVELLLSQWDMENVGIGSGNSYSLSFGLLFWVSL